MNNEDLERKQAYAVIAVSSVPLIVMSIISFVIGLFITTVCLIGTIHSITYVETTAEIVDVQKETNGSFYAPVYEFKYKGKKVRADGIYSYEKDDIIIGEKDTIIYNPNNYKQFDVGTKKTNVIGLIIGIIILIFSITLFVRYIRVIKNRVRLDNESSNW